MRSVLAASVLTASLVFGAGSAAAEEPYRRPGSTTVVSSHDGTPLQGSVQNPVISANGRYIAFESGSTQFGNDTNEENDIFVHDRVTGEVVRASLTSSEQVPINGSFNPTISADGRYVAFTNFGTDLADGVPGGFDASIFVRDLETGTTEWVSRAPGGETPNGSSSGASISADGRHVAFSSGASNLVPNDTNNMTDVFVFDRVTGTTEIASVNDAGVVGDLGSTRASISGNGRYVAFQSLATNLAGVEVPDLHFDVFVRDLTLDKTIRASKTRFGTGGDGQAYCPSLNHDGTVVAFHSVASNLVPDDTNLQYDQFVADTTTGEIERVSVDSSGAETSGDPFTCGEAISADGRYVTFHSFTTLDGPTGEGLQQAIYVHDRELDTTDMVSVTNAGQPADGPSVNPSVSGDGRYVVFQSRAANLGAGGEDGFLARAFLRDRGPEIGIERLHAHVEEGSVVATGTATFAGGSIAEAADPAGDAPAGTGTDLLSAEVLYRPERGDLLFRWVPDSLPGPVGANVHPQGQSLVPTYSGAPVIAYAMSFATANDSFVAMASKAPDAPSLATFGLYRCDVVCEEVAAASGGYGTAGVEVTVSIPLTALDVNEGAALQAVSASTSVGVPNLGSISEIDAVPLGEVTIPVRRLTLSLGATQIEVPFTRGAFSARIPGEQFEGPQQLVATACFSESCGSDTRQVELPPNNRPPVIQPLPIPGVDEGKTLTFRIAATDPDGDVMTYALEGAPSGAVLDGNMFSWSPTYSQAGTHTFDIVVSDGTDETVEEAAITVRNVPAPTSLRASVDKSSGKVRIFSTLTPPRAGRRVKITLLRKSGTGFKVLNTKSVTTDRLGRATSSFSRSRPGRCKAVVSFAGTYELRAASKTVRFRC
jgi:Tol biopolymer transport system component